MSPLIQLVAQSTRPLFATGPVNWSLLLQKVGRLQFGIQWPFFPSPNNIKVKMTSSQKSTDMFDFENVASVYGHLDNITAVFGDLDKEDKEAGR